MRKLFLSGLVVTGLILGHPAVSSADPCPGYHCFKCAMEAQTCKITQLKNKVKLLWENKEALGIKEDQLSKIKDIKHAAIKKMIQLKADKEIVEVDLNSALYEDSTDLAAVNTLIDTKYAAETETAKTFVKAVSDIKQVLTQEQRDKWKELYEKEGEKGFCPLGEHTMKK